MGDDGHWMEKAFAGSHGQFRAKAKRTGKSTAAEAKAVLKPGSKATTKTKRQAVLARTGAKYGGHHHEGAAKHAHQPHPKTNPGFYDNEAHTPGPPTPAHLQENPGEADMHTQPTVPMGQPHSFRPPATSNVHGYGHAAHQRQGHHRHSGHPGAHRIGHK